MSYRFSRELIDLKEEQGKGEKDHVPLLSERPYLSRTLNSR